MIKAWSDSAWEDFKEYVGRDRKILKKVIRLLEDIDRNGYEGIGKPEPLKGDFSGYWSRRIDAKNRIVYKIEGDMVLIAQCGTHYGER